MITYTCGACGATATLQESSHVVCKCGWNMKRDKGATLTIWRNEALRFAGLLLLLSTIIIMFYNIVLGVACLFGGTILLELLERHGMRVAARHPLKIYITEK